MIRRAEGPLRPAHRQAAFAKYFEGPTRAVMDQVPIDVQQRLSVIAPDHRVTVPDFFQ